MCLHAEYVCHTIIICVGASRSYFCFYSLCPPEVTQSMMVAFSTTDYPSHATLRSWINLCCYLALRKLSEPSLHI